MYLFGTKSLTAFAILFVNINGTIAAPITGTYTEKSHHLLPRGYPDYQSSCYQLGAYAQMYPQCAGYNTAPAVAPAAPAMGQNGLSSVPSLPIPKELPGLPDLSTLKLPALNFGD
jgi:hypothetical protein